MQGFDKLSPNGVGNVGYVPLTCHPNTPPNGIDWVSFQIQSMEGDRDECWTEFYVGHSGTLATPAMAQPFRADDLWTTTCFEVFVALPDQGYVEFNLSPSFRWAAYRFDGYREGRHNLDLRFEPGIVITPGIPGHFLLSADLDVSSLPENAPMNITAVIEETDGTKSYWALAHGTGNPDFHNRDCFIATLPARTGHEIRHRSPPR